MVKTNVHAIVHSTTSVKREDKGDRSTVKCPSMYNDVHKNDTKSINTYAVTGKPQMKSRKLKIS